MAILNFSGIVTLNRRLDYEVLPLKFISFKIFAMAENHGIRRTSEAEVMINIQDVNDNSPVFVQNVSERLVAQSTPFLQIWQIKE